MGPYLLVAGVAALVTALVVPLVIRGAKRLGAIDVPSDPRKIHKEPVPTLGGLGMIAGFLAAIGVAALLPAFSDIFRSTSEPLGLVVGVLLIGALGIVDDLKALTPSTKLAGQIVACLGPTLFGIAIVYVWVPGLDVVNVGSTLSLPLTILLLVAMINAVNFVDGLDGLAAGVVGIGAVAFFAYALLTSDLGVTESIPTSAPLTAAIVAGMCVGFLVHNFHPASIIMGDTGSMTLGLLLGSAGIAYVGRSTTPTYTDFGGVFPLLIPAMVLAIPMVDTVFAIARRTYRRQPVGMADKGHLHHLLIAFGHSHRRAVLVLYYWSAAIAGGVLALALLRLRYVFVGAAVVAVVGLFVTAFGIKRPDEQAAAEAEDEDGPLAQVHRLG